MQTNCSRNDYISLDAGDTNLSPLTFELQPIVFGNGITPFGYEMLIRGRRGQTWLEIDRRVLRYLHEHTGLLPPLFVNLANESLLSIPDEEFVRATNGRNVIFEISETHTESTAFDKIAEKVNNLIELGVRFAIDDFGSGRDGLQRLYSLPHVSVVKIDGAFLINCMRRSDASLVLQGLVAQWRRDNILVVAECVESSEILQFANRIGIELAQGWHIDALVYSQAKAA